MSTHLRILVAEDEDKIAESYRVVLKSRGHDVKITKDGQGCVDAYMQEWKHLGRSSKPANNSQEVYTPFDVVILDYRMPVMDGMEAARIILTAVPGQRIVFASAYLKETLLDSLRHLNRIIELISKPFSLDQLVEVVEDEHLYKQLQALNVDIERLKSWEPTHVQIYDLLNGLIKIRNLDPHLFKKQLSEQSVKGI
jgi:CheY-like chemotaxis protein